MEFVATAAMSKGLLCTACTKPWEPETAKQCIHCEAIHCDLCQTTNGGSCHHSAQRGCPSPSNSDGKELGCFSSIPRLVRQLAENAKVKCQTCEWTGIRIEHKTHPCTPAPTGAVAAVSVKNPTFDYAERANIPAELQCTLCQCPFVNPMQLPCEHVFCNYCITTSLSSSGLVQSCPIDHKPTTVAELSSAPKMIRDMVEDLPVFCTYKCNKCEWVGPRSLLPKHVSDDCTNKKSPLPTCTNTTNAASNMMLVEAISEYPSFEAGNTSSQDIYALAHLTAPRLNDLSERKKPLSISAVIDVSGSMSGGKLKMAQESLQFMIDELTDRDELGIIAFHTEVAETIVLTKMDELGKKRCKAAALSLRALQRTNLSGGLFAGMDQVQGLPFASAPTTAGVGHKRSLPNRNSSISGILSSFRTRPAGPSPAAVTTAVAAEIKKTGYTTHSAPDTCRAVLLFTDGIANGGLTDEFRFKDTLTKKLNHSDTKDMVIHTFGFGADHNARLLQGLAEIASGSYYYIQDVATMKESFADCLGGLLSTVAQNIQLTITPSSTDFTITKVHTSFKQVTDAKTGATTVTLKDVYSTEKRDLLVQLKLTKALPPSSSAVDVVHLAVKYDSVLSGSTEKVQTQCRLVPVAEKSTAKPNQTVQEQRTRIEATEAMAAARQLADAGDIAGAKHLMCRNREAMKPHAATSSYVSAMLDDMDEVEDAMATPAMWVSSGSKAMAQAENCHQQQRMNRASESKVSLGYDNKWKEEMRCKSRKM